MLDRAPEAFASLAAAAGIDMDFARAVAVESALEDAGWVELNAAQMLYTDGRVEAQEDRRATP